MAQTWESELRTFCITFSHYISEKDFYTLKSAIDPPANMSHSIRSVADLMIYCYNSGRISKAKGLKEFTDFLTLVGPHMAILIEKCEDYDRKWIAQPVQPPVKLVQPPVQPAKLVYDDKVLREMGFTNTDLNQQLLKKYNGDISRAIEDLCP